MKYFCCDQRRRTEVRGGPLNGIDFVEVLDLDASADGDRQRFLFVHLINDPGGVVFTPDNVRIEGGERVTGIVVLDAGFGAGDEATVLTIEVDRPGDFSPYLVRLVRGPTDDRPPVDFDPMLSAVEFSFKVECPSDFDCDPPCECPPDERDEPRIDYLAKDYASFRRLILDRLALIAPDWRERNPADLGIALVELLAHVGDHLSYHQDAVGTEAYLGTARSRISVRRHARLIDYFISDGSNARAWVQVAVGADVTQNVPGAPPALPGGTRLFTRLPGQPAALPDDPKVYGTAQEAFETLHDVDELFALHNGLPFYTWSDRECCLPRGATWATLRGHFPNLRVGEVLILEEVRGPLTGLGADADPSHRHAVRLTDVINSEAGAPLADPLTGQEITEIFWDRADALPFALTVSARTDEEHGSRYIDDAALARGNIVLADHGLTISEEDLGRVPEFALYLADTRCDPCEEFDRDPIPPRFRPLLKEAPVTHAAPYDAARPAAEAMAWPLRDVSPQVSLRSTLGADSAVWQARRDLLSSAANAREFVVEIESDLTARLRLGDDRLGARPEPGTGFMATYRVGNGRAGNVGAEAIAHIVSPHTAIIGVRNPLPARGGVEPESIDDVRQRAPSAFRIQERAVTPADYAAVTERHAEVQMAAATFRWSGSWHTVFLTIDRFAGLAVDQDFEAEIRNHVERYRMAGYDLEVDGPHFVPLDIEMDICVSPDYLRSDVGRELLNVLGSRALPDGRVGLFHPDKFVFGETVYVSPIYAAAQAVAGVDSVKIKTFRRLGTEDPIPLIKGKIDIDRLEIARLDNDPNFAEHGRFRLNLAGGK
ncbi:MAG: putative baseplate assembly protein [Alphaproteobacteria bacterium]|nr:putative baseplate assembly protein [Alphaproteobacteria bacterium]